MSWISFRRELLILFRRFEHLILKQLLDLCVGFVILKISVSLENKTMLSLKNLLSTAVHRAGIHRQVSANQLVQIAGDFLDAAMLSEVRVFAKIISFRDGTLKIHCKNSIAAHEVKMLEPGIREAITSVDPKNDVRQI